MGLNPEQQKAVDHFVGPCIVTAVPGSGKTKTLTSRLVKLIERNVEPKNILCLTFTNKAAREMKERASHQIGQKADQVWISTFHSLFLAILRKFGNLVGLRHGFSVYDDKDQHDLLAKIARMHEAEISTSMVDTLAKWANDSRESLIEIDEFMIDYLPSHKEIIKEYFETLDDFNAVDFSGILYKTYLLLKNNPVALEALREKFRYISVDEWQDTNHIQYEIIKLLGSHQNVFVVGDPNQSIFSWRGAKPENIEKIKKDFQNVVSIQLPRNYRSKKEILKAAQSLISHNGPSGKVELISERGDGAEISLQDFEFPESEATFIANQIKYLKHKFNYKWHDFAILYRINTLSKIPEMTMRAAGIPYKIYGGFSFFDRSEIKTTVAYLKFLSNPHDTVSFTRAIKFPKRSVGDVVIGKLERFCQKDKISMLSACKKADLLPGITNNARKSIDDFVQTIEKFRVMESNGESISKIASGLINETGYYGYMKEESKKDIDSQKRVDNIDEFLSSIADFESQKKGAKMSDYLQSIEIFSDDKDIAEDAISLLTMHSSKGLEFPVVFIVGLEKDYMPHKMCLAENPDTGAMEERRLLYVAITRAKDRLYLSYCNNRKSFDFAKKSNRLIPRFPSPFLHEI